MRSLALAAAALSLALLPACSAQRIDSEPPTVSYSYVNEEEYDEVAEMADDYCDDQFEKDAELIDRDQEAGGYEATFACR